MAAELAAIVVERVRRRGPLPFEEVIDLALYHPAHGFYGRGQGAGRQRDFLTSPEVGPLFGAVIARALDTWWAAIGEPDPFVVVEAGAGIGTLAAAVVAAGPRCAPVLRYLLVERSEGLRRQLARGLHLEPASLVLGPASDDETDPVPGHAVAVRGRPRDWLMGGSATRAGRPRLASLPELPVGPFDGVVIANELLDNLAFGLLQRSAQSTPGERRWDEVRVDEGLREVLVPAAPDLADEADRWAPGATEGARIPLQRAAAAWLRAALTCLRRGRVVVVDYADTTPGMARRPWTEWARTYRAHGRGAGPLADLGDQDVTCDVALDQLAGVRQPIVDRSQADFLVAHGIDALVTEARQTWHGRAAIGDLAALTARSRVTEAAALTDPTGLGAFRVLEWQVG
ncbi:MAG: SAM-dependent methyltransferase [Actinomycetota bacterium]|nr:SAM-dependent methyltransferase [Actinomycetota bacterium]